MLSTTARTVRIHFTLDVVPRVAVVNNTFSLPKQCNIISSITIYRLFTFSDLAWLPSPLRFFFLFFSRLSKHYLINAILFEYRTKTTSTRKVFILFYEGKRAGFVALYNWQSGICHFSASKSLREAYTRTHKVC